MESRFPVGPVGAGPTRGSFPGEPLVAMPLSLSFSPNADRIISESCYCLRGEIVGDVTSRDVQSVCPCFGGAASTRLRSCFSTAKYQQNTNKSFKNVQQNLKNGVLGRFLADLDYPREKLRPLMRSELFFINF